MATPDRHYKLGLNMTWANTKTRKD